LGLCVTSEDDKNVYFGFKQDAVVPPAYFCVAPLATAQLRAKLIGKEFDAESQPKFEIKFKHILDERGI